MKTQSSNPKNSSHSQSGKKLQIAFGSRRRAIRLLWMKYTIGEVANVIGVPVDFIHDTLIPAGCPHSIDETGGLCGMLVFQKMVRAFWQRKGMARLMGDETG